MFKTIKRVLRSSGGTVLRGAGSAAVAAVGWKLASDLYDTVKKRMKGEEEVAEDQTQKEATPR